MLLKESSAVLFRVSGKWWCLDVLPLPGFGRREVAVSCEVAVGPGKDEKKGKFFTFN